MVCRIILAFGIGMIANYANAYEFRPFLGTEITDPLNDRLCPAAYQPDEVEEKWFIQCNLEGANFSSTIAEDSQQVSVMAYNIERGYELTDIINGLQDGSIPKTDIILLSEADRGCSRSGEVNSALEMAQALSYNYVFGVEFVELERDGDTKHKINQPCEHGQAILSKYPLGNVRLYRHKAHGNDKYIPAPDRFNGTDEARLGTRADLVADIKVGERYVRVASIHYDDGPLEKDSQTKQAKETLAHLEGSPIPVIIGGDTNAHYYFMNLRKSIFDGTTRAFLKSGYFDSHSILGYKAKDRKTINNKIAGIAFNAVVDVLFSNREWVTSAAVCKSEVCLQASDHRPVWASYDFRQLD